MRIVIAQPGIEHSGLCSAAPQLPHHPARSAHAGSRAHLLRAQLAALVRVLLAICVLAAAHLVAPVPADAAGPVLAALPALLRIVCIGYMPVPQGRIADHDCWRLHVICKQHPNCNTSIHSSCTSRRSRLGCVGDMVAAANGASLRQQNAIKVVQRQARLQIAAVRHLPQCTRKPLILPMAGQAGRLQ